MRAYMDTLADVSDVAPSLNCSSPLCSPPALIAHTHLRAVLMTPAPNSRAIHSSDEWGPPHFTQNIRKTKKTGRPASAADEERQQQKEKPKAKKKKEVKGGLTTATPVHSIAFDTERKMATYIPVHRRGYSRCVYMCVVTAV